MKNITQKRNKQYEKDHSTTGAVLDGATAAHGYKRLITIEDGIRAGGFGEAVQEYYADNNPECVAKLTILAIPDHFVTHGSVAQLKHDCAIDQQVIVHAALS